MLSVAEFSAIGGVASGEARTRQQRERQEQVIALHTAGLTNAEIARRLSVSQRTVWRDLVALGDSRIKIEAIIEDVGIDAHDAHLQLTRFIDADVEQLFDDAGELKPMRSWPAIFRQGFQIVVEEIAQRSNDGVQAGESKAWDKIGRRIKILGIDPQRLKAIELAMKHKGVDAMVQPSDKLADAVSDLAGTIGSALAEGRARAKQRKIPGE